LQKNRINQPAFNIKPVHMAVVFGLSVLSSHLHAEEAASVAAEAETLPQVTVAASTDSNVPSEQTGSYKVENSNAATGLDLSLRGTPQVVSVITSREIEDYRLTSVNDALENVAGIVVERVETDRTYYSARGSDITNFQLDGVGLPLNYGLATGDIDTAVYDRIEVIRGANGLMSSTGNPSATVNFVRKRPTEEFNASVDVTAGSWNDYRVEGDIAGPLNGAGNLRGRLVAVQHNRDSYLDRYEHEKSVFYGILEADITDHTRLTLGHTYQKNEADGVLWGALPLLYTNGQRIHYDVSASTATDWAYWDTEDNRTFAELAHEFQNGWQAKAVLSYRKAEQDANMIYMYGTPSSNSSADMGTWPSTYLQDNEQWLADVQVKGPFSLAGREHQLIAGANWARSRLEEESRYGTSVYSPISLDDILAGTEPNSSYPVVSGEASFRDRRSSIYAAAHFSLSDRLNLIGGARMTSVESKGESYAVPHEYEHDDKVTPYAGIVYDLTEQHSAYASYTDIFNPQTEMDINRKPLAPLEGKSYEAGIKSEWLNKRLNTTFAVFRSKQDNVAESAGIIPGSFDTYYRGVTAVSKGIEIDVAGDITDRLQLRGGYTALSIRGEDDEDIRTYVPRHMFNLATSYRVPMLDKLKVGMNVKWRGDIHRDIAGTRVEQDSYTLVDLMAAYKIDKNTTLALNVDNVTDRKYLTSLMWDQSFYAAPRSASLTLSWKY